MVLGLGRGCRGTVGCPCTDYDRRTNFNPFALKA